MNNIAPCLPFVATLLVFASPSAAFCRVLPLRQRKVRKSSVLGLRLDRSWMDRVRAEAERVVREVEVEVEVEGTGGRTAAVRLPGSATLTGVVLGEFGCDWANFLWAWSRGLRRRRQGKKEE